MQPNILRITYSQIENEQMKKAARILAIASLRAAFLFANESLLVFIHFRRNLGLVVVGQARGINRSDANFQGESGKRRRQPLKHIHFSFLFICVIFAHTRDMVADNVPIAKLKHQRLYSKKRNHINDREKSITQ